MEFVTSYLVELSLSLNNVFVFALAVTRDFFIVFTSNVMAMLGLRSLYFALAGIMQRFHALHYGLAAIPVFVGAKMCLVNVVIVPTIAALLVVGGILAASVLVSLLYPPPGRKALNITAIL